MRGTPSLSSCAMPADHLTVVDTFYAAFGANNAEMLGETVTQDFRIQIPVMDYVPLTGLYVGSAGFEQLLDEPSFPDLRDQDMPQLTLFDIKSEISY
jgi:hypothetical protein